MSDTNRQIQLLERRKELLLKKGQVKTDTSLMGKTDKFIGDVFEGTKGDLTAGAPTVAKPVIESALDLTSGFIPGGRAAASPFLKDEATRTAMGIGAGLVTAPAATVGSLAGGVLGGAVAPEGRENIGILAGGMIGGGVGAGLGKLGTKLATKSAGGVINSLIKPKNKALQFGKNPGKEVADQGITGNSFEQLGKNIDAKTSSLWSQLKNTVTKSKKKVDLSPALKPVQETLTKLKQNPKTNAPIIKRVENFLSDLLGSRRGRKGKFVSMKELDGMDAVTTKQGIGDIAKFTGADDPPAYTALVHKVYHIMKTQIEHAIPETKGLNSSLANLIGASKAIPGAISRQARQPLGGVSKCKVVFIGWCRWSHGWWTSWSSRWCCS